jgi:uncharacterized protein YfaS (alpha-2-macroglobulin family)
MYILKNMTREFNDKIYWVVIILWMMVLTACGNDDRHNNKPVKGYNEVSLLSKIGVISNNSQLLTAQQSVSLDYSQTSFEILDFSERDYKGVASLGIVLSVPLDAASEFQQYFILERRDGERVDGGWILSTNGKELFFKNIEPETDYLLTVYANITAVNGKILGQRYQNNLTTKAIKSSVTFAHDGGILPLSHAKGLPVYSVNIEQVDIEFHRIQSDKILAFLDAWRGGKQSTYLLKQYAKKSQFVYAARFELPIEKNKRERVMLPISHIDALKPAGIYMAVMKVAGQYDYRQAVTYFIRSDIGVHVRRYVGTLDVYLRSLVTADSITNTQVSLLDNNSQILTQAMTDKTGLVSFTDVQQLAKARLILAQNDQQISIVKLNSPALDLSEFNVGTRKFHQNEAFIYAPRDLYRPSEQVELSVLVRNYDGQLMPNIPLKAVIKQQDGQVVERFTWYPKKLGYYYHAYQLATNATTGRWHIEVTLPGNESAHKWYFSVEDFLPERMKLTVSETENDHFVTSNGHLQIPIEGRYLYGAPASGNRLGNSIDTQIDQHAVSALPDYLFGLATEKGAKTHYDLPDIQLDEQGKTLLSVASTWQKINSPILIRLTSSLFETGGRAIKRQAHYRLWPTSSADLSKKLPLIGIRPYTDKPKAKSLVKFDVVNANNLGQLSSANQLHMTLIKKRRDYYWSYDGSGEWDMQYSEKQYPVLTQSIHIENAEKTTIEIPVEWGEYRLEIFNPETQLTTSVEFNAGGAWYSQNEQAKITRPDKVTLSFDKSTYQVGETAQLLIKSPFSGKGMVLVENNKGKLWQTSLDLQGHHQMQVAIPIADDWQQHDIYVSVVLFNTPMLQGQQQDIKRAVGLLYLPLDRESRKINFRLKVAKKSQPFSMLPVTIQLDPFSLKKLNSLNNIQVTLAAVDVGVLNVSRFQTPDPFQWFFAQRRYDVDSLDLYGNIINARTGIMGKQRFGGDMDLTDAGNLQKADVKIVSLFHQPVSFNEQGMAQISLAIPDFNGQLRLMAVAFSDHSFGQTVQDIIIAAPLVTQLSMPRFLAANDVSQLTLDVHNLTEKNQVMIAQFSGDSLLEIIPTQQPLSLQAGEKKTLFYHLNSQQQFGLASIHLDIHSLKDLTSNEIEKSEIGLQRDWQLPIRSAWPAVIRHEQAIIDPQQSIHLQLKIDDLIQQSVEGEILVSNQPPINLATHLKHLLKYPYGCLEQSTSSSFPWLLANKENIELLGLQDLKIKNKVIDFSQREHYLQRGVKRIAAKQLSNGGFGLWSNQGSEELWLTVYATHFLIQAKNQGVDVPNVVLKSAIKRLQYYLRSNRSSYNYRYSDYPAHTTLAYKSYAAYVLSLLKQAPLGTMRTLFDYHRQDDHSGLPLMHLGIALSRQGDKKRGEKAIIKALTIDRERQSYLGDYGSALRDISLMLDVLLQFQSTHSGVDALLSRLQDELAKRQWLSTQERNALFMVGMALKENGQKQWQAILTRASGSEKISHQGDFKQKIKSVETDLVTAIDVQSLTEERLYTSLEVSGYTQQAPNVDFENFTITRTYYNTKGEMIIPEKIAVGELMIVELSLQSKYRIQDALVVDLLPAGFEIENQNLEQSIKLTHYQIEGQSLADKMSTKAIKYQAWRDDRYIAAIDMKGYSTQHLYYLLRAVTPGNYQIPPPYAEDMYRPYIRAIGLTPKRQIIFNKGVAESM